MNQQRFFLKNSTLFWINLAFWLALSILEFIQIAFYALREGQEERMAERSLWISADFITMWILSFGIFILFVKTHKWSPRRMLWVHVPSSLLYGFLNLSFSMAIGIILVRFIKEPEFPFWEALGRNLRNYAAFTLRGSMIYWVVMLILYALDFYTRYRKQQLTSAQLETRLVQAELQTLKMQLHPHFLFNALNSISMLVRRDKGKEAIEMLSALGDMLRKTLSMENTQFTTLDDELVLLKKYLDIEQVRFRDKLSIEYSIAPSTRDLSFPSLLLQPILENAFKHGIANSLDDAKIRISSEMSEEDKLKVCVFNTGPLLERGWRLESQNGIGLSNTLSRLKQLYGEDYSWSIENAEDEHGVKVCLSIPAQYLAEKKQQALPLN